MAPLKQLGTGILLAMVIAIMSSGCRANAQEKHVRHVAFLAVDGVFNSELMAPYDVIHHSIFRDTLDYLEPFVVSPSGESVTTFEGLEIGAHYSFENVPPVDILVIPSAEGSMSWDLENKELIDWIRETANKADYVITLCDGAFPLAQTGLLDGMTVTTFPADRDELARMYPELDVQYDPNFVADGKYITSVGGALSYEPALYLIELLFSKRHAEEIGDGLVLDWKLEEIPHLVVSNKDTHG